MKQNTTKEQTQHLIELGFPKPNMVDFEGFLPEDMAKYNYDNCRYVEYVACIACRSYNWKII